jgi:hypothetical protein
MIKKLIQYKNWYQKESKDILREHNSEYFILNSFIGIMVSSIILLFVVILLIFSLITSITNPIIQLILFTFTHKSEKVNKNKIIKTVIYDIEADIKAKGLLRFSNSNQYNPAFSALFNKKHKLFINDFFNFNNTHDTVYNSNLHRQCFEGKRRSLGDIYRILKYYDNTLTVKELVALLDKEISFKKLSVSYCNQIEKCVFTKDSQIRNIECRTEFYKDDSNTSNIRWNEIVNAFK